MGQQPDSRLHRALRLPGATVVGVGAMLGTGVFAVWTPAYELAGHALVYALGLAALIASLNAISTASLARELPRAGGVYAYGKAYVGRPAGVAAGYAFVMGKSASAGAAALTVGAYAWPGQERLVGLVAVALALALDLRGIVRSTRVTAVLIVIVLSVVAALAIAFGGSPRANVAALANEAVAWSVLGAAGLLFVAFAGYARITVLGEEVVDPRRTIPRAMALSFAVVIATYVVVAAVVLGAVSAGVVLSAAPLESIAAAVGPDTLAAAVRVGAIVAAGAVLVSLIAGIGRTVFAMSSEGDAPRGLSKVNARHVPWRAEIVAAAFAIAVVLVGGIGFALGLSAATILTYYGIAHLSVLARWRRRHVRAWQAWLAGLGLVGCVIVVVGLLIAALSIGT